MATSYKVSPFSTPGLQTYIVNGVEVDETGKLNATGTSGSVYTAHISGGSGQNYLLIWDGVAATDEEAEIVVPIASGEELVMYVDKGITCSTAITFAVSSVQFGGTAPNGNVNANLFTT